MATRAESFKPVVQESCDLDFARCKPSIGVSTQTMSACGAASARLHAFDLDDCPVLAGLADLPGELVRARSTITLTSHHIGAELLVLFESGDVRRPIVIGVLKESRRNGVVEPPAEAVTVAADGQRYIIKAEREIVFECGAASITLTRAGKVIIKGNYILSRSSGYNRIKGAAVDIN